MEIDQIHDPLLGRATNAQTLKRFWMIWQMGKLDKQNLKKMNDVK